MHNEIYYSLDNYHELYSHSSPRNQNNLNNFPDDIDQNYMVDRGIRGNRLKEAVFPEQSINLIPNADKLHTTHILSSMVRLQKPAQRFRFLIANLIDYVDDTDTAVLASDNLSNLLRSKDVRDVEKASEFIHNLCKKQASRLGLASSSNIIDGLRKTIIGSKNANTISDCVSSVQHISKGEQGSRNIVKVDFIPTLLDLLSSKTMKTIQSVVSILDNLMHYVEESKDLIRNSYGVEKLVEQLEKNDIKLLTVVINCLHKLTFNNAESKKVMLVTHGSEKIVQILRQFTYEKLLFATSKLLKVLSVCNSNKPVLVEHGAMEVLSNLLRSGSPRLVLSCLWSVRNLSDYSSHINEMRKLIEKLVELLANDDEHTAICALGCLCNLTSGNVENKISLIECGGVQAVCQLMCERVSQQEVVEPGAAALRHVTHSNHLASQAVNIIIQSPLLSNLSVLIRGQPDKMLPLVKAIVGLTRNLSMISSQCRRSLIDLGITDSLCEIFHRTFNGINELSQQRNSIVSISSELSFVEGVRLDDLLELSLSALQALAKDNLAKKIISYQNRLLQTVSQIVMVKENSISLHRACLGLLAEMIEYADSAVVIEAEGFNTRLSELIHSPNKAISTYAAIVMYVINLNKPEDYRNRLNCEIFESLQDKIADLENEDIRNSNSEHNFGSKTRLTSTGNEKAPRPKEHNSNYYDNRAFEHDFEDGDLAKKPKAKKRQSKPQPFRDVEL